MVKLPSGMSGLMRVLNDKCPNLNCDSQSFDVIDEDPLGTLCGELVKYVCEQCGTMFEVQYEARGFTLLVNTQKDDSLPRNSDNPEPPAC